MMDSYTLHTYSEFPHSSFRNAGHIYDRFICVIFTHRKRQELGQ